jgi:hypothetical protein
MFDENSIDFDFSRSRLSLRPISDSDIVGKIEPNWSQLYVFGTYDVARGGGAQPYLVVRLPDLSVCKLDVESEPDAEVVVLNSGIARFIQTFTLLDGFLSRSLPLPADVMERLQLIDSTTFLNSEWFELVQHIRGV